MADASDANMTISASIETTEIKYLGDLQRLDLKPDDILILKCRDLLTPEAIIRLKESIESLIPAHRVIILEDGMDIGVLHKDNG